MIESQEYRKQKKPMPTEAFVSEVLTNYWLMDNSRLEIKRLDSYDDANFYIRYEDSSFLLKVYNNCDSELPDILVGLSSMLRKISSSNECITVPTPVTINGEGSVDLIFVENCMLSDTSLGKVAVRLFNWIHGNLLAGGTVNPNIQADIGCAIGNIYKALQNFDAPCFHRIHMWDLAQLHHSYFSLLKFIDDQGLQAIITEVYEHYKEHIAPVANASFGHSVIMADCNDANIIVSAADSNTICGIIDFSDAIYTWSVNEVAIAMAYCMLSPFGMQHPLLSMGSLLYGYLLARGADNPLSDAEIQSILPLMCVRLSISIMVGSYSIQQEPENEYLNVHARPARSALRFLWSLDRSLVAQFLLAVRGQVGDSVVRRGHVETLLSPLITKYFDGIAIRSIS